jgi:oxygen-independent coproporphyrinogen-3 oxidase
VEAYVRKFEREALLWSGLGGLARRPVTTVHLGGGTPHSLPSSEFERVVEALASGFATDGRTEWAIETNCRNLDDSHAHQLARLGFTRIHVGVQTLRPRLRLTLGRRDSPERVLARIRSCLDRGWVVSVDMLYGLPEQTTADLLADLQQLVTQGVHGFSLYRLNHGGHNHRFMVRHGLAERGAKQLFADYMMFMEAARLLASCGYAKNHFAHFARAQDRNLYARHAVRGEDLLALGATADGVFGNYFYRHGGLPDYLAGDSERPSLQGGGVFTSSERDTRGLVAQLMSGEVHDSSLDERAMHFVRNLAAAGLLCRDHSSRLWKLTDSGSWFIEACTVNALHIYEPSRVGNTVHTPDRATP